ncbi:MAG: hypothetical protein JWO07_187 [Candidatus Saccharibacteria bacterium]|nr:hypothetical protein [Candidatus Saccharibacteria bacterium]
MRSMGFRDGRFKSEFTSILKREGEPSLNAKENTPVMVGVLSCCGGYRRAISHNICFELSFCFFVGAMFVFVTFADITITAGIL